MEIRNERNGEKTVAYVLGEIDHHNAKRAREILDGIIIDQQPAEFRLDLSEVTFCDSSGLGLVMGRMRKCQSLGIGMIVCNPSAAAEKILEIAGMDKIIRIERGVRNG